KQGRIICACWLIATCVRKLPLRLLGRTAACCGSPSPTRASRPSILHTSALRRSRMRREGSPWRGVGVVFLKELADHLTNMWMIGLQLFVVLLAAIAVYTATQQLREAAAEIQQMRETLVDPQLYLLLFTSAGGALSQFPLVKLLAWLMPVVAIGL